MTANVERERVRTLLAAHQSVVAELSLPGVLTRVVEAARRVCSARYAALGVVGPHGSLQQFLHEGVGPDVVERIGRLPSGRGLLGALTTNPGPIRSPSIPSDPRFTGFPDGHPDMTTFIGVPIRCRGEAFGNLYLADREDGEEFTDDDEELLLALAATAGVAIENARLYEESRQRQEWLRASAMTSRALLHPDSAEDPLEQIAAAVLRLADADLVTVDLRDRPMVDAGGDPSGPERLRVAVAQGYRADQLVGLTYPEAGSLPGAAIRARESRVGHPSPADPAEEEPGPVGRHLPMVDDLGPVMACPLVAGTGVRAAIVVARRAGEPAFEAAEIDMAQSFAAHAAIALELADGRAQRERLMLLEDRDRIARDLHDHVIQRVFATGLSVQSAAQHLSDPRLRESFEAVVDDLDDTIRQIRQTIFELHESDDRDTPGAALRKVAESTGVGLGFSPRLVLDGPVDRLLDPMLLQDVQAVLREALTNVAKHARASHATAHVTVTPTVVAVEVTDDGVGGAPGSIDHSRLSGLVNLAARATARSGSCTLASDGTGTVLRWTARMPGGAERDTSISSPL